MIILFTMKKFKEFIESYMEELRDIYPGVQVMCKKEYSDTWEVIVGDLGYHVFGFALDKHEFLKISIHQEMNALNFEKWSKKTIEKINESQMDLFVVIRNTVKDVMFFETDHMLENYVATGEKTKRIVDMFSYVKDKVKHTGGNGYEVVNKRKEYNNNTACICNVSHGTIDIHIGNQKYDMCYDIEDVKRWVKLWKEEGKKTERIQEELEKEKEEIQYSIVKEIHEYTCMYAVVMANFGIKRFESLSEKGMLEDIKEKQKIIKNQREMKKEMIELLYAFDSYSYMYENEMYMFGGHVKIELRSNYVEERKEYSLTFKDGETTKVFQGGLEESKALASEFITAWAKEKRLKYLFQSSNTHMDKVTMMFSCNAEDILYEEEIEMKKVEQELGVFFSVQEGMPIIQRDRKIDRIELPNYDISLALFDKDEDSFFNDSLPKKEIHVMKK